MEWHAFALSKYLHTKMYQEPSLQVLLPPLSPKFGLHYLFHGICCERSSYGPDHGDMKRPMLPSFKACCRIYLLSRTEWCCLTLTYLQADCPSLDVGTDCSADGGRKALPETRSQMPLNLLNNQAVFVAGKYKFNKAVDRKVSLLLLTIKLT